MGKQYDMVLHRGRIEIKHLKLLKAFTKDEREKSQERLGVLKFEVTMFDQGGGRAWARSLMSDAGIEELEGTARAYAGAPEFLPHHFDWETIKGKTNNEIPMKGGILRDGRYRTASPLHPVKADPGPLHSRGDNEADAE